MDNVNVAKKKKRGRGRPYAGGRDPLVALRMPPELTKRIDALAGAEPDQPSRSEMIRRLVELGAKIKERSK
jgi:hypothetical protein